MQRAYSLKQFAKNFVARTKIGTSEITPRRNIALVSTTGRKSYGCEFPF